MIKGAKEPLFDFCYWDGAHTWDFTGLGFFLIDLLLKPGGIIIFDDMDWTINKSPAYQKSLKEGNDIYHQYSENEKNIPAVRMVFENIVPTRGYICSEIKEVNWGYVKKATKLDQAEKKLVLFTNDPQYILEKLQHE